MVGTRRWMGRWSAIVMLCVVILASGCRASRRGGPHSGDVIAGDGGPVARGAVLYAAYCACCHGAEGYGSGPVAMVLNLRPANLHAAALTQSSDDELVERLLHGAPLRVSQGRNFVAEELQVNALAEYLPTLSQQNWAELRTGRMVYESTCAPCHGAYGKGEGVLGGILERPPADLERAQRHYTDPALAQVIFAGTGAMPPLYDVLESREVRAVVAYVRHLSKGYRLYDTYCAGCHGDDGRGVHPEDLLPPAMAAPPLHSGTLARLTPDEQRAKILHMLRRERGMMPHFRDTLDEEALRDIIAYVRSWRS